MNDRLCLLLCVSGALWLHTGCRNSIEGLDNAGTYVGNPGSSKVKTSRNPTVELTYAGTDDGALRVRPCDGQDTVTSTALPLLEGASVELPPGDLCGVDVLFGGPLVFEGHSADVVDAAFLLEFDLAEIRFDLWEPLAIDGDQLILELGEPDWLDAEVLQLEAGELRHITVDSEDYGAYLALLVVGSAAYVDTDADGELSEEERDSDALAEPEALDPDELDEEDDRDEDDTAAEDTGTPADGCQGCAAQSPFSSWWLLAPILWCGRRRGEAPGLAATVPWPRS